MKNILSVICLTLATTSVCAHGGFFLQPAIGGGATSKTFMSNGIDYPNDFRFSYNGQIGVGYEYRRFVMNTGIGYLKTGYKAIAHMYRFDVKGDYSQAVVPVIIGCRLGRDNAFTITPQAGVYASYGYASKITYWSFQETGKTVEVRAAGRDFKAGYENFALLGTVQVRLEKKVNERMAVTCTPLLLASVTNMVQHTRGYPGPVQHIYGGLVELGIKWSFTKNIKREEGAE